PKSNVATPAQFNRSPTQRNPRTDRLLRLFTFADGNPEAAACPRSSDAAVHLLRESGDIYGEEAMTKIGVLRPQIDGVTAFVEEFLSSSMNQRRTTQIPMKI
ncbi:hypothetical protein Droror1_Dr00027120, partial [Drosera rotundifolia]